MHKILLTLLMALSLSFHKTHTMSANHIGAGVCFLGSWVIFLSSLDYAQKLGGSSPTLPTILKGLSVFALGSGVTAAYSFIGAQILNNA